MEGGGGCKALGCKALYIIKLYIIAKSFSSGPHGGYEQYWPEVENIVSAIAK